jgi:hypothetical protein
MFDRKTGRLYIGATGGAGAFCDGRAMVINANDQTSHLLRGGLVGLWSFFEPK